MTDLVFSILTNSAIYLLFKWYQQLGIRIFPAIVINYITAFSLGLLLIPDPHLALSAAMEWPIWMTGGLALGVIFISIFYLMAITAQRVGVAVSTIASKMSLALAALLFVWADPTEHLGWVKSLAIVLAIGGVVFSSMKEGALSFDRSMLIWPLLILFGSTIIDFGIAWLSKFVTNESERTLFSCLSFCTAGMVGISILFIQRMRGKSGLGWKEAVAGVFLGLVNFGSIFFLVRAYNSGLLPMSSLLPVNNLSVVLVGALGAIILFRERLSAKNWIGVALSVLALVLLLGERSQ